MRAGGAARVVAPPRDAAEQPISALAEHAAGGWEEAAHADLGHARRVQALLDNALAEPSVAEAVSQAGSGRGKLPALSRTVDSAEVGRGGHGGFAYAAGRGEAVQPDGNGGCADSGDRRGGRSQPGWARGAALPATGSSQYAERDMGGVDTIETLSLGSLLGRRWN